MLNHPATCIIELRQESDMAEDEIMKEQLIEDLRDSEMKFRSLAQSAVDGIICADSRDRIIFWNKAAENMFGYREEEILEKPVITLIPESFRTAHREGVKRYLETGQAVLMGKTMEVQALSKEGSEFPVELSLASWSAKGEVFFTAIIRDITGRKEMERALEYRTQEAKERKEELESLIQMVAHDLKSPVLTIEGLIRVLKRNVAKKTNDEKQDRILDQISESSETLEIFLRDLLDGLAAEAAQPKPAPINLHEAVAEVLGQHEQAIEEKGIRIEMEIPDSLPKVYADEHRLKQVLDNLVTNSIRYMGGKCDPRIRIQAFQDKDAVITSISDTGIGIPPKFQARIFERFFRVPDTGVRTGSGLGLFVVKKIVENYGGNIWLESEEGKGTTFRFALPQYKSG